MAEININTPVDEATIEYFKGTGRSRAEIAAFEGYFRAQKLFGIPKSGKHLRELVVNLGIAFLDENGDVQSFLGSERSKVTFHSRLLCNQPCGSRIFIRPQIHSAEKKLLRFGVTDGRRGGALRRQRSPARAARGEEAG